MFKMLFLFLGRVILSVLSTRYFLHCIVIQCFITTSVTNVNILFIQKWNIHCDKYYIVPKLVCHNRDKQ